MSDPEKNDDEVVVSCAVCLKEIPHEHAGKDETEDYVRYFCGLECYQQWKADENTAEEE